MSEDKKKPKKNLYTAIKEAATQPPHEDTGNNNLYVRLGLKPPKPTKQVEDALMEQEKKRKRGY